MQLWHRLSLQLASPACYAASVKTSTPTPTQARELFEVALRARGVTVVQVDGGYEIHRDGGVLIANIENLVRQYVVTGDVGLIESFVDQLVGGGDGAASGSIEAPTWDEVRYRIYWSLEARDVEIGDALAATVSRDVRKVLVWTDPNESHYTFITPAQIEAWGVDAEAVMARAQDNQASLLDGKSIEVSELEERKVGMIPIATGLKASAILAGNFKAFVGDAIAWPVYVVVPCRDFALIFAQRDQELIDKVGPVVLREFQDSGYPITAEIFAIDDAGIKAIGKFEA